MYKYREENRIVTSKIYLGYEVHLYITTSTSASILPLPPPPLIPQHTHTAANGTSFGYNHDQIEELICFSGF